MRDDAGDRRLAVAHGEVDAGGMAKGGGELVPDALRGDKEGRALGGPYLGVGMGGILGTRTENDALEQEPAGGGREIEDAFVAEKFPQVAANVGNGRGSG